MRPIDPALFDTELFPTPRDLAVKMYKRISDKAQHFLEPSAGRGDLAEVIKRGGRAEWDSCRNNVDCIELSPELAAILRDKDFPVVGHDWLDYAGVCYYDAIVMNPPFSRGDEHLLQAWNFIHDGEIVCLLNEETISNPCNERRKLLAKIIEQYGEVEMLGNCFAHSDRPTGVRIAMVYLKKVAPDDAPDLWNTNTQEKDVDGSVDDEPNLPALIDKLGNMQHYYDQANEHMHKAFAHLRKAAVFMGANDIAWSKAYDQVLTSGWSNLNTAKAEFGKQHRRDSWMKVFEKMEFHKWLDKKQREQFLRDIERNGNIPFTADNIKGTLENIFQQRSKLFEMSVANVFEELTKYHAANRCHTEGWKSNDSFKVNRKLVFPWGCRFDDKYTFNFSMRWDREMDVYNDLDRVLAVLARRKFEEVLTVGAALDYAFRRLGNGVRAPFNNRCRSSFFDIKFFKKGTVHLVFLEEELWEAFNVTAAKGRAWLGENTRDEDPTHAATAAEGMLRFL